MSLLFITLSNQLSEEWLSLKMVSLHAFSVVRTALLKYYSSDCVPSASIIH